MSEAVQKIDKEQNQDSENVHVQNNIKESNIVKDTAQQKQNEEKNDQIVDQAQNNDSQSEFFRIKKEYSHFPQWYQREIQSQRAIDINKFQGNFEDAVNFYYKQVQKLFFANTVLTTQLKSALSEKEVLNQLIEKLEQKQKPSDQLKKRRQRRCANQIERKYVCPVKKCERNYGALGSLSQHMRLKHPNYELQIQKFQVGQYTNLPYIKIKKQELMAAPPPQQKE